MNRFRFLPRLALLAAGSLLAACGGGSSGGDKPAAGADQGVAVTTAAPRQQVFHDTVEAWGSVDPLHPVAINLAHAGQVTELAVAPGQAVKRGATLLTVTPDPATRSAFVQAQNAARTAAGDLKRIEQLAADRLATQSQLAGARRALADAKAALEAQRALGGANSREQVKAPLDGVVTTLQVQVGERFAANAPLLAFTPSNALLARLGVQPQDAAKLRVGLPVQLREVYLEGTTLPARLSMVGKAIDPASRLLPVLAEVPTTSATPIAGTALSAVIQTADYRAWAVPRAAVLHDQKGDHLFVVERGKARRVAVTVRHPEGDVVGVRGALEASSQVIVLGVYELNDGDAVRVAPVQGRAK